MTSVTIERLRSLRSAAAEVAEVAEVGETGAAGEAVEVREGSERPQGLELPPGAVVSQGTEGAQAREAVRLLRLRGQLARFATIGVASTVVNLGLLALLHHPLGSQLGNAVALLVATVLNTAANRRWTFGVRGSDGLGRHHLQSLTIFAITWACSSGALALLALRLPGASTTLTVAVVAAANVVSTVIRFVAMSRWIFRPPVAPA